MIHKTILMRFRTVFYPFLKYHVKILLEEFNAKGGGENNFKPRIGNRSLHQDIMIMVLE